MKRNKEVFAEYRHGQDEKQYGRDVYSVPHLPRNGRHWSIDDFAIGEHDIVVDIRVHNTPQQIVLAREAVDTWLHDTGRLRWDMEAHDEESNVAYISGATDADDYWRHAELEVRLEDLKRYMSIPSAP